MCMISPLRFPRQWGRIVFPVLVITVLIVHACPCFNSNFIADPTIDFSSDLLPSVTARLPEGESEHGINDMDFAYEWYPLLDYVRLYNTKLDLKISKQGGVFIDWKIKGTSYNLAVLAPVFQAQTMFSPMDILPDLGWNAETYLDEYNISAPITTEDTISVELTRRLSTGIEVRKCYEFYRDCAFLNITETIVNLTDEAYNITSVWNPEAPEGFMVDLLGQKDEHLAFQDDSGTVLESGLHWQWLGVENLKWMGLFRDNAYARIMRPFNTSGSVYGESTSWDGKVARLTFEPCLLPIGDSVAFKYSFYGGAFDFEDMSAAGLSEFYLAARGPRAIVDCNDIWTIEPEDHFSADLNLSAPFDPINDLSVDYSVNGELISTTTGINLAQGATTALAFDLPTPHPEGVYSMEFTGVMQDLEVFRVKKKIAVLDSSITRSNVAVSFVFHHHQPWYVDLNGHFMQPFAQSFGPIYYEHLEAQYAHPSVHVTANLQPCLIKQWQLSTNGYTITLPTGETEVVDAGDERVLMVQRLLDEYSTLGKTERLEIMTSPYFHPILAILGNLGYEDDGVAQTRLGMEATNDILDIDSRSIWSPEETFNDHVVRILNRSNAQYTVLDDRLLNDSYPGYSNRVPYYLEDPASGLQTIAFFRDSSISNDIAFNWNGIADGDEAAREFLGTLVESLLSEQERAVNGRIHVTLSMDGENWMTENGLLERMYQVIEENDFLTSLTLQEQLAENSPSATTVLDNVREGSWGRATSLITWQGTAAKDWVWDQVNRVNHDVIMANATLPAENSHREQMILALFISEGSDYSFWEETIPSNLAVFAQMYANESFLFAQQINNKLSIDNNEADAETNELDLVRFKISVTNEAPEPLCFRPGIEGQTLVASQLYEIAAGATLEIDIDVVNQASTGDSRVFNVTLWIVSPDLVLTWRTVNVIVTTVLTETSTTSETQTLTTQKPVTSNESTDSPSSQLFIIAALMCSAITIRRQRRRRILGITLDQ